MKLVSPSRTGLPCSVSGLVLGLLVCIGALPGGRGWAGPTDRQPDAPLETRAANTEAVEQLAAEETAMRQKIQQVAARVAEKKWTRSYAGDVRTTHITARKLERMAERLEIEGEPAGAGLHARGIYLDRVVDQVSDDCRKIPNVASEISKDRKTAHEKAENMARRLNGIETLAKRGNWEEAYSTLSTVRDEVSSMALWYYQADRTGMLGRFDETWGMLEEEVTKQRVEAAQEAMQQEIEQRLPDLDGLLARVDEAAKAVRTGGRADFDGQLLSGPELMGRFGEEWKNTLVLVAQCRALNAGRRGSTEGTDLGAAVALEQRQPEFAKQMVAALAELIQADADQAPEPEVRDRYLAYLPVVGTYNALSADDALATAAQPALDRLAAKSASLHAEVQAYRAVTDDLLRWRRRIAAAYAKKEQENFPPIIGVFESAAEGKDALRDLIPATTKSPPRTGIRAPLWEVLESVSPGLIGKPARAEGFIGLPTRSKMAVSRYADRSLVQVNVGDQLNAEIEVLKAELLLDDSLPPLSLPAATALVTAERGDLVALGGNIRLVAIDAVVTRFRDLIPSGWPLALADFYSDGAVRERPLSQVLFRYTVDPVWLHHEYLFARVSSPEPAAE